MALPRAHTASSSPAQAGEPSSTANAGRLMSTAPKQKPTGSVASASVRTPPDRNAPSRPWLPASASGSHSRDGRCATNAAVPASEHAAHRPSAAIGEIAAMIAAAASGPTVKTVSITTESSAKAVSSSSSRPVVNVFHSARIAAPTAGIANPPTKPVAISAAVGAPASVSATSTTVAVTSTKASGSRTRRCPIRSIRRLCSGIPIAEPSPNAPLTRPATANESRSAARYRTSASPYIAIGSRAISDAASSGTTCGVRRIDR